VSESGIPEMVLWHWGQLTISYLLFRIAEAHQKQESHMRKRRERRWEESMSHLSSFDDIVTTRAIDDIKSVWRVLPIKSTLQNL
jgi:hypothetical protein